MTDHETAAGVGEPTAWIWTPKDGAYELGVIRDGIGWVSEDNLCRGAESHPEHIYFLADDEAHLRSVSTPAASTDPAPEGGLPTFAEGTAHAAEIAALYDTGEQKWIPDDQHGYSIALCECEDGPYLGARQMGTPCVCENCRRITPDQWDFLAAAVKAEAPAQVHLPVATSDAGGVQAGGAEGLSDIEALEANVTISALMAGRISGPQAVAAINGRATGIVSAAATRARAEGAAAERERIAEAIEARRVPRRRDNTQGQIDTREALDLAARIARGDA